MPAGAVKIVLTSVIVIGVMVVRSLSLRATLNRAKGMTLIWVQVSHASAYASAEREINTSLYNLSVGDAYAVLLMGFTWPGVGPSAEQCHIVLLSVNCSLYERTIDGQKAVRYLAA